MWPEVESLLLKRDKNDDEIEKILPWLFETVKCFHQIRQGWFVVCVSYKEITVNESDVSSTRSRRPRQVISSN